MFSRALIQFRRKMSSTSESIHHLPTSDLFETKGVRWLYNDELQRSRRKIIFDANALCDAVVKAIPSASRCTSVERLSEGTFNRLFLISTDNGAKVVARLPFPTAGPKSLLTQSEVATLDFLHRRFNGRLPVPQVLAWSSTHMNPVGSEYILMEYCDGMPMGDCYSQAMTKGNVGAIAREVSKFQVELSGIAFSQIGSIYYIEHVSPELQKRPLYARGVAEDECSSLFRVGPSVDRILYRSERAQMKLDRGPWPDMQSYFQAIVSCESSWIMQYGEKSAGARAQAGAEHLSVAHLSSYGLMRDLAPYILPSEPELNVFTLGFPDLHPGNILVEGNQPMRITAFLDWQGACVRPRIENFKFPPAFAIPDGSLKFVTVDIAQQKLGTLAKNSALLASMSPQDKERAELEEKRAMALMAYFYHIKKRLEENKLPFVLSEVILPSERMESIQNFLWWAARSWEDGLSVLHRVMMEATQVYCTINDLESTPVPFPMDLIDGHVEGMEAYQLPVKLQEAIARRLIGECGISVITEGEVREEDYDRARKELEKLREEMLLCCEDEDAKEALREAWPFQDGKWSTTAEICL